MKTVQRCPKSTRSPQRTTFTIISFKSRPGANPAFLAKPSVPRWRKRDRKFRHRQVTSFCQSLADFSAGASRQAGLTSHHAALRSVTSHVPLCPPPVTSTTRGRASGAEDSVLRPSGWRSPCGRRRSARCHPVVTDGGAGSCRSPRLRQMRRRSPLGATARRPKRDECATNRLNRPRRMDESRIRHPLAVND